MGKRSIPLEKPTAPPPEGGTPYRPRVVHPTVSASVKQALNPWLREGALFCFGAWLLELEEGDGQLFGLGPRLSGPLQEALFIRQSLATSWTAFSRLNQWKGPRSDIHGGCTRCSSPRCGSGSATMECGHCWCCSWWMRPLAAAWVSPTRSRLPSTAYTPRRFISRLCRAAGLLTACWAGSGQSGRAGVSLPPDTSPSLFRGWLPSLPDCCWWYWAPAC